MAGINHQDAWSLHTLPTAASQRLLGTHAPCSVGSWDAFLALKQPTTYTRQLDMSHRTPRFDRSSTLTAIPHLASQPGLGNLVQDRVAQLGRSLYTSTSASLGRTSSSKFRLATGMKRVKPGCPTQAEMQDLVLVAVKVRESVGSRHHFCK